MNQYKNEIGRKSFLNLCRFPFQKSTYSASPCMKSILSSTSLHITPYFCIFWNVQKIQESICQNVPSIACMLLKRRWDTGKKCKLNRILDNFGLNGCMAPWNSCCKMRLNLYCALLGFLLLVTNHGIFASQAFKDGCRAKVHIFLVSVDLALTIRMVWLNILSRLLLVEWDLLYSSCCNSLTRGCWPSVVAISSLFVLRSLRETEK